MENVVSVVFAVESEAYQAMTTLKKNAVNEKYVISQAALVKKANGRIAAEDGFDTGLETADDAAIGGLVGGLLGVVGGPLGMLLTGSLGALTGSLVDTGDAVRNVSLLEKVTEQFVDGETAIIALVQEDDTSVLDEALSKFQTTIVREDAAEVAAEVKRAQEIQKEMERQARKQLREDKKESFKQEINERRNQIKSDFDALKKKISSKD